MSTENLGGLFDMSPVIWRVGDKVIARTMWGNEEGVIESIETLNGDTGQVMYARVATTGKMGVVSISLRRLGRA